MIDEDIQFEVKNKYGKSINCVVISSIPISESEVNIMYKREDDPDDVFRYGKIIKKDTSYEIKKDLTDEELLYLKESFNEAITNAVTAIIDQAEVE